ncbi:MAG TPA: phospholipid carrier-dependent glycosyltransferase, partial [Thermoanaerobaculia bacterium]|nr:phospholipid carrier-dependent glycosyltransferase [Thermoanaerobaculia bacterium]
ILPHANGVVYLEKPPLLYWLVAASMRSFRENAFAARLPSALAAFATTGLLVAAGRRLGPRSSGALAGVIFATSMGLVLVARQVLFDSLLTLWTTLALLSFWFGTASKSGTRRCRPALVLVGYAALALALLTKGLVGVALPVLTILTYSVVARDAGRMRRAWSVPGIVLFLAIAVPWHVAAALAEKRFAWFYFVNEHWLRFLGRRQPADFHEDPLFSPVLSLVLLLLPWGVFLAGAFRSEWREREGRRLRPETVFLFCWALVPALFFTLSRTRTYYYQLPSVPALALLLGRFWARAWEQPRPSPRPRGFLFPAAGLAVVVAAAWLFAGFGSWGSLRNAAWHALAFACGGWLLAGLIAGTLFIATHREKAAFAAIAAGVLGTIVVGIRFAAESGHPVFRSDEASARLIASLGAPEGTRVAVEGKFENHSSLAFYLPRRFRPLLVVDAVGQGDLAFGSTLEDTRGIFVSTPTMFELTDNQPLFYLTLSPSKLRVPPKLKLVTCDDETMLWTNIGEADHLSIGSSVQHPSTRGN